MKSKKIIKILFVFIFAVLFGGELCAEKYATYIQPTFGGAGAAFYDYAFRNALANRFGVHLVGLEIAWSVWHNGGTAAGDLYVGTDFAFEYWMPTKHEWEIYPVHLMRFPMQAAVSYEFETNNKIVKAVGPWYSMGGGINIISAKQNTGLEHFKPSFRWGLGVSLAFKRKWVLKVGFGGDEGPNQTRFEWNSNSFVMAEVGYRL